MSSSSATPANPNPESLFLLHKEQLNEAINETLSVIENLAQFHCTSQEQKPSSIPLDYPNADGNLAKSLKILDKKEHESFADSVNDSVSYLNKLKARLCDKQSRIMITGDLNAGKSTLVNALIGRKLLPTDQQPCTQAFCEVIPADASEGREFKILGFTDNSNSADDGTELSKDELELELQREDSTFKWFKVFTNIPSDFMHSNVSVSLIDSPGLNTDQIKTTCLFSQQQDIDVIIFVINASFHLTLSGRQFLQQAAKDRQKIFFVVNKFDEIVNAEKCKIQIYRQIGEVLPEMSPADMKDLIYFVSVKLATTEQPAKEIEEPQSPAIESSAINLNIFDDEHIGDNGPEGSKLPPTPIDYQSHFEQLKKALVDFVFLKRSISKLAPAKTYTTRLLQDLLELAAFNIRRLTADNRSLCSQLDQLKPFLHQKEAAQPRLQLRLTGITEASTEQTRAGTLAAARSFHSRLLKVTQCQPFGHIFKATMFVNNVFTEANSEYAEFCSAVHKLTETARTGALEEMDQIRHEHAIEPGAAEHSVSPFVFTLPPQLPMKQPSLLDLFDPRSIVEHFGILNLTSVVSGIVAYQPLLSICYRLAGKLGINPVILGLAITGGIGIYLTNLASSSIELSVRSRLHALFSARFSPDGWAVEVSERASQAVFVYLTGRAGRIACAYGAEVERSRQKASQLQATSAQLADQILLLKEMGCRIESLIGQVSAINL